MDVGSIAHVEDIETIAGGLKVPVIVKGICRPDDALQAVEHGEEASSCQTTVGAKLDSAPATIEALPAVVQALGGRVPVLVDGGNPPRDRRAECPSIGRQRRSCRSSCPLGTRHGR